MRLSALLFLGILVLSSCGEKEAECPKIWELDKNDIASTAYVNDERLVLMARNSTSPNSITLSQQEFEGNFEASIQIESFQWDSLVRPQFRFEVYNLDNPNEVGGIAINEDAYFTYIETTENRDMRIVHSQTGELSVKRDLDTLFCSANIGGIQLVFKDVWTQDRLGLRLVLGTTTSTTNTTQISLASFNVSNQTAVESDDFQCRRF